MCHSTLGILEIIFEGLAALIPPTKLGTRVIHKIINLFYLLTENYVISFFEALVPMY